MYCNYSKKYNTSYLLDNHQFNVYLNFRPKPDKLSDQLI